jgi:YtfJ family uncharacterized protein
MKHFTGISTFILALLLTAPACWALQLGQVPPPVVLSGDLGGCIDGKAWNSNDMKGKVSVIFYVAPNQKDLNNAASEALKKAKFPDAKFQTFGMVNVAASWLPKFTIDYDLKQKQKLYPRTIYVRDYKKVLVKDWKIGDNNSDVLAFDKNGKLIFEKDGKLSDADIQNLLKAVSANL